MQPTESLEVRQDLLLDAAGKLNEEAPMELWPPHRLLLDEPVHLLYLRTRVWERVVFSRVGMELYGQEATIEEVLDRVDFETARSWITSRLHQTAPDGPDLARWERPTDHVRSKTLALVEKALDGTWGIYCLGPDNACLWEVMEGKSDGKAIRRFLTLSGLTLSDMKTPELLPTLLEICPEISVHALAAMMEQLLLEEEHLIAKMEGLPADLIGDPYMIFEKAEWRRLVEACRYHPSTQRRLKLYGMDLLDPFAAVFGQLAKVKLLDASLSAQTPLRLNLTFFPGDPAMDGMSDDHQPRRSTLADTARQLLRKCPGQR